MFSELLDKLSKKLQLVESTALSPVGYNMIDSYSLCSDGSCRGDCAGGCDGDAANRSYSRCSDGSCRGDCVGGCTGTPAGGF